MKQTTPTKSFGVALAALTIAFAPSAIRAQDSDGDGLSDFDETNIHMTNPLNPDTDNDDVFDGVEVLNTATDPLVDDFDATGLVPVDFTDDAVHGKYYGLIKDTDGNTLGHLYVKVSKRRSFSGKLIGFRGSKSSFKGKMDELGQYDGQQFDAFGLSSSAVFKLAATVAAPNMFRLGGVLTTVDGRKQYFSLRRAMYGKKDPNTTTLAGNYTLLMPSNITTDDHIPAGDGFAYGTVKFDGKVKLKGYSNAGNKFSYSGFIVEGDQVPFFTYPKNKKANESAGGVLRFRDIPAASDLDGIVSHNQTGTGSSGVYAAGYDESLSAIGSRYVGAGFAQVPASTFASIANNAVASFAGGTFGGESYVFTWQPKGKMTAPKLPIYLTKGKMKNKTGYFYGKYDSFDTANDFLRTRAKFRGVVIQKQNIVSGSSVANGVSGRYSITPNDTGDPAPTTTITPRKKKVSSAATSYILKIVVDSAWQIEIPAEATWVSVDIVEGLGNGQVIFTVEQNTGLPREVVIKVAGLEHKLEQDFR